MIAARALKDGVAAEAGLCLAVQEARPPRILVPVDCSDFAEAALDVAACTARLMRAEVLLVAVVTPERELTVPVEVPYPTFDEAWPTAAYYNAPLEATSQAHEAEQAVAEDYLHGISPKFEGVPVTFRVALRNAVAPAVIDYARDFEADLIVMPSHGRRPFAQALLGSVATEVLHSGVAPCLFVKPTGA